MIDEPANEEPQGDPSEDAVATPRLILFDSPSPSTERLTSALEREGFAVDQLDQAVHATDALRARGAEVLLSACGLESESVLAEALALPDGPEVILFEDFGQVAAAFEEVRRLAFDTLARPVTDDEVVRVVKRALDHRNLVADNRRLRSMVAERYQLGDLVSRDPRMGRIFATIETVADSAVTLLIEGESGTGKTVLARAIHEQSSRAAGPFIAVNCGAVPASLLESELFGHVRGAFTGAVKDREGKFEAASGGTIFLDELGTASTDLQVKLLRVIEDGRFERVGESTTREVDVRVIAATNVDLEEEVAAGRFRADLYYRIHVVGIELPPLRERVVDIPILARRFVERFAELHDRTVVALGPELVQELCSDPWPGNVRELENRLERAVLLARGAVLESTDLWPERSAPAATGERPPSAGHGPTPAAPEGQAGDAAPPRLEDQPLGPIKPTLAVFERWLIEHALRAHGGNRQDTARTLGINRTTLFNKMRKYDLLSVPTDSAETPEPPGSPGALAPDDASIAAPRDAR